MKDYDIIIVGAGAAGAFMAYELIWWVQSFLRVRDYYAEWLTELVLEVIAESSVFEACSSCDRETFALTCYLVFGKCSGLTFEKVVDLNACKISYLINECKTEVIYAFLIADVLSFGYLDFGSHFCCCKTHIKSYAFDSVSDLVDLLLEINTFLFV